ncbi:MAG TPA: DNA repair exonuclease [Sphaerochaeta sp.]|nr:DNA repair exonuclease [Sphaerochaeta sp.]
MKILCCSDIHMGRIPTVPYIDDLFSHTAWYALVEKALELDVDVLVLAGDVVEQEEHWFEAYGPLLTGLEKLGKAKIKVIAVGGNHDYSVFPSLARESSHITLLGLGGKWESLDYKGVRFIGWSFPERRVQYNPMDSFDLSLADTELPMLGLLHCDVGASPLSSYAPVPLNDFSLSSVPLWVLGHIHKGAALKGGNAFYCGSPYALDRNEEGPHGPWLLEKEAKGPWKEPVMIPLSPYRFETVSVCLEAATDEEDVRAILTQSLRKVAASIAFSGTLLCSLVLTGVIRRTLDIRTTLTPEGLQDLFIREGETVIHPLGAYTDATEMDVDLSKLAQGSSATALLAKKLLDSSAMKAMGEQYRRIERESFGSPAFQQLGGSQISRTEQEYVSLATQAARRLLFSMINGEQGGRQ